ncbi:MAG TPA: hypothetical protein DCY27_15060 [Desulfobacterales bacterium]|nr:hypothetical protein [Desulfobacterales bacterium]
MVRAKFVVDSISRTRFGWNSIIMSPVSGGSEENKAFWAATPGGRFEFNCVNNKAIEQLEVGKEYYVDFTIAES